MQNFGLEVWTLKTERSSWHFICNQENYILGLKLVKLGKYILVGCPNDYYAKDYNLKQKKRKIFS